VFALCGAATGTAPTRRVLRSRAFKDHVAGVMGYLRGSIAESDTVSAFSLRSGAPVLPGHVGLRVPLREGTLRRRVHRFEFGLRAALRLPPRESAPRADWAALTGSRSRPTRSCSALLVTRAPFASAQKRERGVKPARLRNPTRSASNGPVTSR